jgi:hypothetical protein
MSMDAGAAGMYGILLSEVKDPAIAQIYKEFTDALAPYLEEGPSGLDDITAEPLYPEFRARFVKAFEVTGITVPEEAWLGYTGSGDDRPARCATPPDVWVLGLGIFTRPDQWPTLDESFIKASEMHTWVWVG